MQRALSDRIDISVGTCGFSLLEVVVALMIASLALVGLFRAAGSGLSGADAAVRTDEAIERAQSRLAIFNASPLVRPVELTGDDGDGYRWELRARLIEQHPQLSETGAREFSSAPQLPRPAFALYEVELRVSWTRTAGGRPALVMATRRLGSAPAAE